MKYYDSIASGYNALHEEEQLSKLYIIQNLIHVKNTDTLLDVGCGTGICSSWDCTVIGIDPSKKLLNIARKKLINTRFLVGCAEKLPFENSSFNYVICVSAIHLCDVSIALDEIKRVGNGKFVITVLKKSTKYTEIITSLKEKFTILKEIATVVDTIFLLQKKKQGECSEVQSPQVLR